MPDPDWTQDLRHYVHACGQRLLVGSHHSGYLIYPVFQVTAGLAVIHCPICGRKLNLNDCRHTPPEGVPDAEAGPCLYGPAV